MRCLKSWWKCINGIVESKMPRLFKWWVYQGSCCADRSVMIALRSENVLCLQFFVCGGSHCCNVNTVLGKFRKQCPWVSFKGEMLLCAFPQWSQCATRVIVANLTKVLLMLAVFIYRVTDWYFLDIISLSVEKLIWRDCSCKIFLKLYFLSNLNYADSVYNTGRIFKNIVWNFFHVVHSTKIPP